MRRLLFILLLLPALVFSQQGRYPFAVTPVPGGGEQVCATSRWEFDNSDVDENGVNDMTLTDATYSSSYKISGTHSMDCSSAPRYATTDNSISFGNEFFISTWFMTYSTTASERTLFTILTSGEDGFDLRYDRNQTRIEFETGNGASNTVAYSTSLTASTGTWYHVAVSVNTASGVTFFLNGVDVTSSGSLQSGFSTSGQARMGTDWNGSHYSYMYHDHTQWGPFTIDATDADYLHDNPGAELCQD